MAERLTSPLPLPLPLPLLGQSSSSSSCPGWDDGPGLTSPLPLPLPLPLLGQSSSSQPGDDGPGPGMRSTIPAFVTPRDAVLFDDVMLVAARMLTVTLGSISEVAVGMVEAGRL